MRRAAALPGLDPARHERHALHAPERHWVEKNCYIDIWIELLHALGLEPLAMLGFTAAIDFEGDQWTFFKPPHEDLKALYGVDVQELYVWRPLIEHALEHLAAGKFISTEADAFWLPDTAGTDYRQQHTKTTIVLVDIDRDAGRLNYFHNAGYFVADGEDFIQLFRLDAPPDPAYLPLFAELVRHDRAAAADARTLRDQARRLLGKHLAWRPTDDPIGRFRRRFEADLPGLADRGMAQYHAWVFGTLRQLGAAAELTALHLDWLEGRGPGNPAAVSVACLELSAACKSLIMKIARAVNARRTLDAAASFDAMAVAWESATAGLRSAQ